MDETPIDEDPEDYIEEIDIDVSCYLSSESDCDYCDYRGACKAYKQMQFLNEELHKYESKYGIEP